jgi:hypothetical protein
LSTSSAIPVVTPTATDNGSVFTPSDSVGTVGTTFRGTNGTDHVACSAINTELLIFPYDGRIRWTATASATKTDSFPYVGASLPSIVLQPSSGVLDLGQTQVLHISGTYDGGSGATFYVEVTAPKSPGAPGNRLQLFCI